jgi:hypothetical protein
MPLTKTAPCSKCGAPNKELDRERVGAAMRAERIAVGVKLTALAGAMPVSKQYVSDLELGLRPWSDELVELYRRSLAKAVAQQHKGDNPSPATKKAQST